MKHDSFKLARRDRAAQDKPGRPAPKRGCYFKPSVSAESAGALCLAAPILVKVSEIFSPWIVTVPPNTEQLPMKVSPALNVPHCFVLFLPVTLKPVWVSPEILNV